MLYGAVDQFVPCDSLFISLYGLIMSDHFFLHDSSRMIENVACSLRPAPSLSCTRKTQLEKCISWDTCFFGHLLTPYCPTCLDSKPLILRPASNAHVEICEATLAQAMRESELGLPVMVRAQPPPG